MKEVYQLRPVTVADAMSIFKLVNHYASQAQMLPKSQNQIYQNIRDFGLSSTKPGRSSVWRDARALGRFG